MQQKGEKHKIKSGAGSEKRYRQKKESVKTILFLRPKKKLKVVFFISERAENICVAVFA